MTTALRPIWVARLVLFHVARGAFVGLVIAIGVTIAGVAGAALGTVVMLLVLR